MKKGSIIGIFLKMVFTERTRIKMKKILLIEDNQDLAKIIQKRLVQNGFDVIWAADAYIGTQMAHTDNPDLIILDLMIPAGGGITCLKNIRLSYKINHIPVVVLTAMKDDEYKKRIEAEGVQAYLDKSQDIEKLGDVINSILNIPGPEDG